MIQWPGQLGDRKQRPSLLEPQPGGMRWHPLPKLRRAAERASRRTLPVTISTIDLSRPFVPEHYTQLFFTPMYRRLTHEQRLRYNQLFGVRINEFIMMLERDVLERVLIPLRRHPGVRSDPDLLACLDTMIADERRHYAGFVALNRACLPEAFTHGRERYFSELPLPAAMTFRLLGLVARRLAFPLYCLMALEESSMALAREMAAAPPSPPSPLGPLEPHFVEVHRQHMRDEARHVEIQAHLIDACLREGSRFTRDGNSRLFKALVRRMTHVGRSGSGAKVIRHLIQEHPGLAALESDLLQALTALNDNHEYQRSLFNRQVMPKSFQVFDRVPEFHDLPEYLPGYDRT